MEDKDLLNRMGGAACLNNVLREKAGYLLRDGPVCRSWSDGNIVQYFPESYSHRLFDLCMSDSKLRDLVLDYMFPLVVKGASIEQVRQLLEVFRCTKKNNDDDDDDEDKNNNDDTNTVTDAAKSKEKEKEKSMEVDDDDEKEKKLGDVIKKDDEAKDKDKSEEHNNNNKNKKKKKKKKGTSDLLGEDVSMLVRNCVKIPEYADLLDMFYPRLQKYVHVMKPDSFILQR